MRPLFFILLFSFLQQTLVGQDSIKLQKKDTVFSMPRHIPSRATRRSALIPGWGQAYNKQYWKIPLVYGLLAIPAATYVYNDDWYNKTKFAYLAKFKEANGDPSDIDKMDPILKNLSMASLQSYRNIFRRDRDYSIMWFVLAWGVNVVDATVSGHLKEFDINNNLSLKIQPKYEPQFHQTGLSLQFRIKSNSSK
jgi:hypothetical protein